MRRPPKVPRPTPVPRVRSALVDALAADDVPGFWTGAGARQPLVEPGADGTAVVTFCWRDADAAEVLLFANRLTDETHLADTLLERLPGSDLWHATFRMDADWRASYCFLVRAAGVSAPWAADGQIGLRAALDRGLADPRNPVTCRNRAGVEQSVVALTEAPPQPWLAPRAGTPAGTVTHHVLEGRDLWWYDAPGVPTNVALPLVVALDGDVWTSSQSLPTTLDNLLADRATPPVRAVLVGAGDREQRWAELGTGGAAGDQLADVVLPWASARAAVRPDARIVVGQSLGGLTALRTGLARPDLWHAVVSQSASLWQDDLADEVRAARGAALRVHLTHGRQEWVLAGPHLDLEQRLRAAGLDVAAPSYNGGHDYAWWRGAVADGLRWATSGAG